MLEKYRLAFGISPVPLLLAAPDGTIALTNPRLDRLFDYPEGALVGRSVDLLVPPEARGGHPRLRAGYLQRPQKRAMGAGRELQGVTRTGTRVPLELALEPVPVGDETWAMVVAVDIRPRKALEDHARLAMDAAACAMISADAGGRIVFANRAAGRLLGYAVEALVGRLVDELVPEPQRAAHAGLRQGFLADRRRRPMGAGLDIRVRHRSGREIPVEIGLTPVATPEGTEIVATMVDLTQRRAAEAAIARHTAQLEALNADLSQFAYAASHDLKAPLTTLAGLLRFCLEDLRAGDLAEMEDHMRTSLEVAESSARKVEAVLRLAHVSDAGIAPEPVVLDDMVTGIWRDITAGMATPVRLGTDYRHADPICTEGPALRTILENLLSNAVRFRDPAKPAPEVRVETRDAGAAVLLRVADNGTGIRRRDLPRLFDMFKRLEGRSGDGLGLALVRKQVDRLGGSISVDSRPGEGTSFSLTLPRIGARAPCPSP